MGNCAGIVSAASQAFGRPSLPSISGPPPSGSSTRRVLQGRMKDLRAEYTIGRELGRGEFGVTHICIDKVTKKRYACKSIAKRKLVTDDDIRDVRREVEILHHVWGYPNIVQLQGAYEDKLAVHLVLELCSGGELFDRITKQGRYTEQAAAALCRAIVEVIQTCHSLFVMHRDLKPENFLFASPDKDAPLKVTDFGLAVIFKPGQKFTDVVGSAYYIAPEILQKDYGPEADVWSAGVILYILLSGSPPFSPDSDKEEDILAAIRKGHLDLTGETWQSISDGAKDLVRKMLTQDPKARLKPHEILKHPWIKVDGEAPDKPLDSAVLTRLRKFKAMNNLKKVALKVIAKSLSEEEIKGLKQIFADMDKDKSGTITFEELKEGLSKQGSNLAESEIRQMLESADVDRTGTIDYEEFLAATIHLNKVDKEEHLFAAFQYFDKDNSGYITMDELEQALTQHKMMDEAAIQIILVEADTNKDGKIDYEEFAVMMRKGMAPPPPPIKRRLLM